MRKKLSPSERQKVYEKYDGHCAYCGCELQYKDMQVDHIDSVYRYGEQEGKNVEYNENYMPACRACNFYKSTYTLEEFREQLGMLTGRLEERQFTYRLAKKYGLIQEISRPIQFYFEKGGDE